MSSLYSIVTLTLSAIWSGISNIIVDISNQVPVRDIIVLGVFMSIMIGFFTHFKMDYSNTKRFSSRNE